MKMKGIIILLILTIATTATQSCKAQRSGNKTKFKQASGSGKIELWVTVETAKADIKKGQIKIILPGGFVAPTITETDKSFEKKYNVKFSARGCVRMAEDDEEGYNREIFKYLDSTFGNSWRKEIRIDAIGFNSQL